LLSDPDIADKRWVYEQYDQQVQTQTTLAFGRGDAAVIAPRGTKKGLALKLDGNARWTFAHPYRGGLLAVCESARNVACTGAKPVAVTDGLNFGNPTYPHVYWQFDQAVKGIADAADAMETPVISGNVSFYNESELGEVPPTPIIGMLGVLEDANTRLPSAPIEECDIVLLKAKTEWSNHRGLGASMYLRACESREDGYPEAPDLRLEKALCRLLVDLSHHNEVLSAHDVSDGGMAVALAEMADSHRIIVHLPSEGQIEATLFGEFPGYVFVGTTHTNSVIERAAAAGIWAQKVGVASKGDGLVIEADGQTFEYAGYDLKGVKEAIPTAMSDVY
jgi:phosphoribosylformylglycinamidine synthase